MIEIYTLSVRYLLLCTGNWGKFFDLVTFIGEDHVEELCI